MSKIQANHLGRQALIYVRQSTLRQVRENLGSQERQYDLVRRALDLGWAKEQIAVIDQDQGRSGASVEGRDGFQQLVPKGHLWPMWGWDMLEQFSVWKLLGWRVLAWIGTGCWRSVR